MRRMFAAIGRHRPRMLTLIVLLATAGLIAFANLRTEIREVTSGDPMFSPTLRTMPYGWPLFWYRRLLVFSPRVCYIVASQLSAIRLAGNVAMWLLLLAIPAGICEWLLRRYRPKRPMRRFRLVRPRLRWSLRSMLIAVGLVAMFCGWFVNVRHQAEQDSLIAAIMARGGRVWVERWGPKWLDLPGADRFRRQIYAVDYGEWEGSDEDDDEPDDETEDVKLFKRLRRLPELRSLDVVVGDAIVDATARLPDLLGGFRQLRRLRIAADDFHIDYDSDAERFSQACLAAVANMNQLEELRLEEMGITGQSLSQLSGLANLKYLRLADLYDAADEPSDAEPLLSRFPPLPRVEVLELSGFGIDDDEVPFLAALPRLKSLSLANTLVTDAGLAQLPPLEFLEELEINADSLSAGALESLLALKRLKAVHVNQSLHDSLRLRADWGAKLTLDDGQDVFVPSFDIEGSRRALKALRESKRGIVVDTRGLDERDERTTASWQDEPAFTPERRLSWRGKTSLTQLPAGLIPPERVEELKGLLKGLEW